MFLNHDSKSPMNVSKNGHMSTWYSALRQMSIELPDNPGLAANLPKKLMDGKCTSNIVTQKLLKRILLKD